MRRGSLMNNNGGALSPSDQGETTMLTYNINDADSGNTLIGSVPAHKVGMYDDKLIVTIDVGRMSDSDNDKINDLFDSCKKFILSVGWTGEESGGGTEYEISEANDKSDYNYDVALRSHIKIYELTVANQEKWSV